MENNIFQFWYGTFVFDEVIYSQELVHGKFFKKKGGALMELVKEKEIVLAVAGNEGCGHSCQIM